MLLHIPKILNESQLAQCHSILTEIDWEDGSITAGIQAAQAKNNQQIVETHPQAKILRNLILEALSKTPLFFTAALPRRIYPPLFNCYQGEQNSFGNHVDNAIRTHALSAQHLRTDLSFTLFLSSPDSYSGGELMIENGSNADAFKLPAGDLILYPSYSIHRVEPVTQGKRWACVSWVESMVRASEQRDLLHQLDLAILAQREQTGDNQITIQLTNCYHNLLRMWAVV